MTFEIFITVLVISASATSIGIEMVKQMLNAMGKTYKTMPMAVIIAFVIGVAEIIIYTLMNGLEFNALTIIYAVCMGAANVIGSNVGYDKVKEFISALMGKIK